MPLGTTFSELNRPIHRRPEMMRLSSAGVGKATSSLILEMRDLNNPSQRRRGESPKAGHTHLSDASEAPIALCVTSAQLSSGVNHSLSVSLIYPILTNAVTNSGNP